MRRRVIDGHLDLAWNVLSWRRDISLPLEELNRRDGQWNDDACRGRATTSLPELRRANVTVCLATLLARAPADGDSSGHYPGLLDYPSQDAAHAASRGQLAYYERLEARGDLRRIATAAEFDAHWEAWRDDEDAAQPVGAVIAMEGCDSIVEPSQAEEWFGRGLRCASLVHYGSNVYAAGTGREGPVTPLGFELLREFERVGMILDVTHLADEAFFGAVEAFGGPVVASHNNCRALVPHQRQFSDEQLRAIIEREGLVALAMDAWMLQPGWVRGSSNRDDVPLERVADHADHLRSLAGGVESIAIGTDLDGGFGWEQTPKGLDRISDVQKLGGILSERGYTDDEIDAIFWGNWRRFLREHLPAK